jgi:hypothetical protein
MAHVEAASFHSTQPFLFADPTSVPAFLAPHGSSLCYQIVGVRVLHIARATRGASQRLFTELSITLAFRTVPAFRQLLHPLRVEVFVTDGGRQDHEDCVVAQALADRAARQNRAGSLERLVVQ